MTPSNVRLCPYVVYSNTLGALQCVWSGARKPKGCNDNRVRIFRLSRGEKIPKKMLCVNRQDTQEKP